MPRFALLRGVPLAALILFSALPCGAQDYVALSWNDLGMHCMNQWHAKLSVLPPYNTLYAQVIRVGDAATPPQVMTAGIAVEYCILGNTYSVGKTDFWTYAEALFGVNLPPDVGLTGKGLTGLFDPFAGYFKAEGIPVTPFPDATPTVEDPFQQAHILVRDGGGVVIAESEPVIPVSVEIHCVNAGCHASETSILNGHPRELGFDPARTPILCASCHASPALGTTGDPEAGYFSFRIHEKHDFLDITTPGINGCYRCHPGPGTRCLRGTMNTHYGLVCQDCHGTMRTMYTSIEQGRVPWLQEPACRTCHTAAFGEPPGQLFRMSTGHGGVYCAACHGSPHAEFPSREARDNVNMVALQGRSGVLSDCRVCHGTSPAGPGPHGTVAAVGDALFPDAVPTLLVSPSPTHGLCTIEFAAPAGAVSSADPVRVLVFDARGRTVRLLSAIDLGSGRRRAQWDGRTQRGTRAPAGTYFLRADDGASMARGRVVLLD